MEAQREVGKTCRCLFPVLLCSFLPSALLKYREKRQGGGAERDRQERNQRGGRSVRLLGQILEEVTYVLAVSAGGTSVLGNYKWPIPPSTSVPIEDECRRTVQLLESLFFFFFEAAQEILIISQILEPCI